MTPFDLLPDDPLDWLRADRCRPAEVREVYVSRPREDEGHDEHFDALPKNTDLYGSGDLTLTAKATLDDVYDEHIHTVEGGGDVVVTPAPAKLRTGSIAPVVRVSNAVV